ncbi:hypothetical protein ABK249_18670 [Neorhizobium sp. Rsf11]|uniref:Uncharacterized protein n=1 Tax=Neorhizobium phenanthreniclasticum TaxID=3157917 RepID=A0ABV0M6C4_9HYPH
MFEDSVSSSFVIKVNESNNWPAIIQGVFLTDSRGVLDGFRRAATRVAVLPDGNQASAAVI